MTPIELGVPRIAGSRIEVDVSPGSARRYFAQRRFWVDYGDVDLSDVPAHVALLPALGTVLPVAIATGVPVVVPALVLDGTFSQQAAGIDVHLRKLYPALGDRPLQLQGPVADDAWQPSEAEGAVLLYSGGVDSVTSLIRHRAEVRALLSVWGADVEIENTQLWGRLQAIVEAAPTMPGVPRIVARTNMRRFLDELRLDRDFDRHFADTNWWGGIHHGLGLATIAAPVSRSMGVGRVVLASSHSVEFAVPWGSSPDLDNQVKWSGAAVEHDGFHLNRQAKIGQVIEPFVREGRPLDLAVCYQNSRGAGSINCGRCEKCLRTASGLLAAGVDPADAGVPVGPAELEHWQQRMDGDQVGFSPNAVYMWSGIQQAIAEDETNPYLRWLRGHDLQRHATDATGAGKFGSMAGWKYAVHRLSRRLPYGLFQRLRTQVKQITSRP